MDKLRTLNLPPHRGRDFFVTVFVEPDPDEFDSFDPSDDARQWGISVHFQPNDPYASHVEVARIDTGHGEPHFDRLYRQDQPKESRSIISWTSSRDTSSASPVPRSCSFAAICFQPARENAGCCTASRAAYRKNSSGS